MKSVRDGNIRVRLTIDSVRRDFWVSSEAEKKELKQKQKVIRNYERSISPELIAQPLSFQELVEIWIRFKSDKKSIGDDISMNKCHLIPYFKSTPIQVINEEAIRRFTVHMQNRKPPLNPKTINNVLTLLVSMLRFAARRSYIKRLPFVQKLKEGTQGSYKYLKTQDEIDRFLKAVTCLGKTGPDYMLYSGLKRSRNGTQEVFTRRYYSTFANI